MLSGKWVKILVVSRLFLRIKLQKTHETGWYMVQQTCLVVARSTGGSTNIFLMFAGGKVFRQADVTLSRIPTWERVKRTFGGRLCVHTGPGMSGARSSALRMTCDLFEKLLWLKRGV